MSKKIKTKESFTIPEYSHIFFDERRLNKKNPKFFRDILKLNWVTILLATILYAIMALPVFVMPIITAEIIDLTTVAITTKTVTSEYTKKMIIYGVILAVCILQNVPSTRLKWRLVSKMLRRMNAGIRSALVKKLQSLSITYHKDMLSGKIQAKFIKDAENLNMATSMFMNHILANIVNIAGSVVASFTKQNLYVSLFFLLSVPLNIAFTLAFRKVIRKTHKDHRVKTENMSAKMATMIEMMPVTKSHGLEENEIVSIEDSIKSVEIAGLKADSVIAHHGAWLYVLRTLFQAVCLFFCCFLAIKGLISIGEVVMYQTLFTQLSGFINNIVVQIPHLSIGVDAASSLSEVMTATDVEVSLKGGEVPFLLGKVEFKNVTYVYPRTEKEVIKDFNLVVNPGECIAVVGASGSGKSTLMNVIIGFLRPTNGEIYIDDKPLSDYELSSYRHHISVVQQNSILFSGTIRDNITYGLTSYTQEQLDKVIEMANVKEFLGSLSNGLDTVIGEHGDKLSGGQKQRITIARALIRNPQILIFDEATSALDNISEHHVQKAIASSIKGRTTFIVAHRLSTIRDADRIVVMDDGKMVECGTYDELMAKKGKFFELKKLSEINVENA